MNTPISPNQFHETLMANVNNEKMSDAQFREFVRTSTQGMKTKSSLKLISHGKDASIEGDKTTLEWIETKLQSASRCETFVKDESRHLPLGNRKQARLMPKTFKGFEKEDGTIVDHAFLDGGLFGDRLLEGVIFKVIVDAKGQLSIKAIDRCSEYFNRLNTKKLLKEGLAFAQQNDCFQEKDTAEGGEDLILITT